MQTSESEQPSPTSHTPLPWEAVRASEHHGPYVTTAFGTTVCDLYAMSEPVIGKSKPVSFTDADLNVQLIAKAVNCHGELLAVVRELVAALTDGSIQRNPAFEESDDAEWLLERAEAALTRATAA